MRLATWNVLNGTSLADGRVDLPRFCEAVRGLGADVLGLQEVDRGQPRSGSVDLVREAALASSAAGWRFVPALVGTPGADWRAATDDDDEPGAPAYGVGLVSRYPVRAWHVLRMPAARARSPILLPGSRQVVWLADEPRVAVAAVLDTPAGVLSVATTHLSFVPGWNVAQLRRLTRWLARLPGPHVLLGDLNMPPAVARLVSRWQVLGRCLTFPSPQPRVQLDHVLGRGALPPVRAFDAPVMTVSDHRPLVVDL